MISVIEYTTDRFSVNVREKFLNLEADQVREALEGGRSALVNVCMNLTSDFNKASVVRAANAFLARETYMVETESAFPLPSSAGLSVKHSTSLQEVVDKLHSEGYFIWAVDNIDSYNPQNIFDATIPEKSAFVFGRENDGLYEDEINLCDGMIFIPMIGAARSLNVAQAASVTMSEYTRRYPFPL